MAVLTRLAIIYRLVTMVYVDSLIGAARCGLPPVLSQHCRCQPGTLWDRLGVLWQLRLSFGLLLLPLMVLPMKRLRLPLAVCCKLLAGRLGMS